jgi:hypothetical protein
MGGGSRSSLVTVVVSFVNIVRKVVYFGSGSVVVAIVVAAIVVAAIVVAAIADLIFVAFPPAAIGHRRALDLEIADTQRTLRDGIGPIEWPNRPANGPSVAWPSRSGSRWSVPSFASRPRRAMHHRPSRCRTRRAACHRSACPSSSARAWPARPNLGSPEGAEACPARGRLSSCSSSRTRSVCPASSSRRSSAQANAWPFFRRFDHGTSPSPSYASTPRVTSPAAQAGAATGPPFLCEAIQGSGWNVGREAEHRVPHRQVQVIPARV